MNIINECANNQVTSVLLKKLTRLDELQKELDHLVWYADNPEQLQVKQQELFNLWEQEV